MGKKPLDAPYYEDPFQMPRANPKHAARQVNGETEKSQAGQILESNKRHQQR
ncbi:YpzG family protein [Terrilactibacillus sp. S3-3]|nr:YpzG family protein [Terrilactibacillus sp. S3-3]